MGSITDVPGVRVGHEQDEVARTGVTVALFDPSAVGAALVLGPSASTRGFESLHPFGLAKPVHAVCFAGGSTFGLGVTDGVQRFLRERGRGLPLDGLLIPLVPTAIIFDLFMGDAHAAPNAEMAYRACEAARDAVEEGNVGAGCGALVGKLLRKPQAMTGGVGTASASAGGATVGALAVVNAFGDVRDPATGALVAGTRRAPDSLDLLDSSRELRAGRVRRAGGPQNTTLVLVATDAGLSPTQCAHVARMASCGLARAVSPVFTTFDGDLVVVVSLGTAACDENVVGEIGADLVGRAILRGVLSAKPAEGLPCAADLRR